MRLFVLVALCLQVVGMLVRVGLLAAKDYPRVVTMTRADDSFDLLCRLGFALWAGITLWGMP